MTIRTRGILTNCMTERQSIVDLNYHVVFREDGREEIALVDGVTGYESFIVDKDLANLKAMSEKGWMANVGTKDKYDKLYIPAEEMKLVLSLIKEMRKNKEDEEEDEEKVDYFYVLQNVREYINRLFIIMEEIGEFNEEEATKILKQIDKVLGDE